MIRSHGYQKKNGRQSHSKQPNRLRRESSRRKLLVERLESRRLLAVDYGDAPDVNQNVGPGNYQTTSSNDGPAHEIVSGLFLGRLVDDDTDFIQGSGAKGDDHSTLLADLTSDFVAAIDPATMTAGAMIAPEASGGGSWQYLISESIEPSSGSANLRSLAWDTTLLAFEDSQSVHSDGSNGDFLGFPAGSELTFNPSVSSTNLRPVARWIASAADAGSITIEGRIRKSSTSSGNGTRLLVYADSALILDQAINAEDGRGFSFVLSDLMVSEGSTVDFVIDANGDSSSDSTRLNAVITRGDDEDGVVGGTLEDIDVLQGRSQEIQLVATNLTDTPALLAGWIDFNQDGVFDNATERAIVDVPIGSDGSTVTLVFPEAPANSVFTTYARFRLSSDAEFVIDPDATGLVDSGEVEDYRIGRPTHTWVGNANNQDVFDASNWAILNADGQVSTAGRPPRFYENAYISEAFANETLAVETTGSDRFRVRSLQSAANIELRQKGLLQINQDSWIAGLTLDGIRTDFGDSLQGSGSPLLTIEGDLVWNQAQINALRLNVLGNFLIASDREHSLLRSTLDIYGESSIWSAGDVNANGSTIRNHGTLTTSSNGDFLRPGPFNPSATLINEAGASWIHDAPLISDDEADLFGKIYNQGTLQVKSGRLAIGDCCTPLVHRGDFSLLPDAELTLRSAFELHEDSSVQSELGSKLVIETSNNTIRGDLDVNGTLVVEGGIDFDSPTSVAHLFMEGGSILASSPVNVTEHFEYLGGTLGGGTITSENRLSIGSVSGDGSLTIRSTLINQGEAEWTGQTVVLDNGTIINHGDFVDSSDGNFINPVFRGGTIENHGDWTVAESVGASGAATRNADVFNHGDFVVAGQDVSFGRFEQNTGVLRLVNGNMTVVLDDLKILDGELSGIGQINASVVQSGGTISPGSSPGQLHINGNLIVSEGNYVVEIAGPPADNGNDAAGTNFDRLNVSGDAHLDQISIQLLDDFQPQPMSRYVVLQAASITGPSSDNATGVGMELANSDTEIELIANNSVNTTPTADAGGPYVVSERANIVFDASASIDNEQASDELLYEWDIDYDGTTFDVDYSGSTVSLTYDNNSNEPIDIAVRVTDSDGLFDIDSTTVTVNNVAPEWDGIPGFPRLAVSIDSDYLATLTGQFIDPGNDSQTVAIDWGDGSPTEELALSANERQFSATRSFPIPDTLTNYLIGVTVTDQDGESDFAEIELLANEPLGTIRGQKFEDQNGNAIRDPEEPALPDWEIQLVDEVTGEVIQLTNTSPDGSYEFTGVQTGSYQVREVQQAGWIQTFPVDSIRRISLDQSGQQSNGASERPALSATGRYVAFSSLASNLVPNDTNSQRDIFVKDTVTGDVERVSISVTGEQANGPSYSPAISADGNVIAFRSLADNLVQDDRNVASDIFVHDRRTGVTRRVSVNLDLDEGNENSFAPSISNDGRFIAYESTASNLVPGDTNRVADIFVADLFTGLTERVSIASGGTQSDRASYQPSISGDGQYVVFTSASQSFDDRDREIDLDVYAFDRSRDELTLVSKNVSGEAGNGDSYDPSISADGSTIAFASSANNLFPGDSESETDIFVFDNKQGRLQQITYGNASSVSPSLNEDGTLVSFTSRANNLVVGDQNEGPDIFLYDRELVSTQRYGQVAEDVSHFLIQSSLSADGSTIGFSSDSDLLVPSDSGDGDTNGLRDIFVQSTTGVHQVEVAGAETIEDLDFGNQFRMSSIQGQKFSDINGNGIRDTDPETGEFVEPGLNGWTIRLVDSRTGETWETETTEIDLNADGRINPILERGVYQFGPLPPGDYDVYEVLQDGSFPTFPRITITPQPIFRAIEDSEPAIPVGSDPRLVTEIPNTGRFSDPVLPVTRVEAVSGDTPEQLPILYVKGFNDDGVSWAETGQYFTKLADITNGQTPVSGSANIQTYGVQFWAGDDGDPLAGAAPGDPNDNAHAVLKSLEELADPNQSYHKPGGTEFIADSIGSIIGNLFDPEQWVPVCTNLPNLQSCSIPALSFDFQAARSDYNQNGLAEYHADDLFDLISESLGQPGKLEDFSQVNFVTHSAGGLDTRAFLSLLDDSPSQSIRQSVANVIYTAPPFGGSTLAELAIPFFENDRLLSTLQNPWTSEVLSDAALGPLETLIQAFIAEPIVATLNLASDQFEGGFTSLAERTSLLPNPEEIRQTISQTIDEFDTLIKSATASLPGGSLGISELNDLILAATQTFTDPLQSPVIDRVVLPLVKQVLTTFVGLPGLPKIKEDLRPYEAIHNNLERFSPNTEIPQFVVWGEGGFLRYLTQKAGGDPSIPTPVNLGPPLELAASDPNSLHAYGDANRNGLDFNNLDLQPGDGNLSRTSALFMTDLVGGYMTALAGFSRHTHGSITTDPFGIETNIQGSFLDGDDDNAASVGEVLVETFLTPVTALEISQPTIVVNPNARLYRIGPNAELSFAPEDREFMDLASRVFHVTADAVEYRLDRTGSEPTEWQQINHETFQRSVNDITATLGLSDQERFTIEWRSINQQGGREAIRSANFIIDSSAPGLNFVEVVDAESSQDDSQIALPSKTPLQNLIQSDRLSSRFNVGTLDRLEANDPLDYIVSLDRDKTIRLQFDSPVEVRYQWNDPELSSPRPTTQGNPSQGITEFLIRERLPFTPQIPGLGVDYLQPGVHTLYYEAEDLSGNVSEIQSLTILIDQEAPTLIFSEKDGQLIGPDAPLTLFANDSGAGVQQAFIDLPGIGSISDTATFTLGETDLHEQISSGDEITLVATGIDRVANTASETYTLRYDYETPEIELLNVTDSVMLFDGRFIATVPEVRVAVSASDDTA
ncbi:MAG: SdrD B-like domain-containing protein, partial [Planctomycetota bacterium]